MGQRRFTFKRILGNLFRGAWFGEKFEWENDDVFCQQDTPSPLCCILPYSFYANTSVCSLYLKKRDKKHQKQGKKAKKAKNLYAFDDFEGTKSSIFAEKAIILLQPRNTSVCDRFLCIRVWKHSAVSFTVPSYPRRGCSTCCQGIKTVQDFFGSVFPSNCFFCILFFLISFFCSYFCLSEALVLPNDVGSWKHLKNAIQNG